MIQKFQKAERNFIPEYEQTTITENLEKFIKENFKIPDNDLERICSFIRKDRELEKIIFELPAIVQNKIQYKELQIRLYDEFQNEEYTQLEVIIFADTDVKTSLKLENELENELYDMESTDKILIIME